MWCPPHVKFVTSGNPRAGPYVEGQRTIRPETELGPGFQGLQHRLDEGLLKPRGEVVDEGQVAFHVFRLGPVLHLVHVVGIGLVPDVEPLGQDQPDIVQCRGPVPGVGGGQDQFVLVQLQRRGAQRADLAFPE